jgi:hypothetical protein
VRETPILLQHCRRSFRRLRLREMCFSCVLELPHPLSQARKLFYGSIFCSFTGLQLGIKVLTLGLNS